jgi:hypothetical protein
MSRVRAADDFEAIRLRMEELQRERARRYGGVVGSQLACTRTRCRRSSAGSGRATNSSSAAAGIVQLIGRIKPWRV